MATGCGANQSCTPQEKFIIRHILVSWSGIVIFCEATWRLKSSSVNKFHLPTLMTERGTFVVGWIKDQTVCSSFKSLATDRWPLSGGGSNVKRNLLTPSLSSSNTMTDFISRSFSWMIFMCFVYLICPWWNLLEILISNLHDALVLEVNIDDLLFFRSLKPRGIIVLIFHDECQVLRQRWKCR